MTKDNIIKLVDDAVADNPFTEDALALRFSDQHRDDLRYLAIKAAWLKWDGSRWYAEATYLAFDLARASCRTAAEEAGRAPASVYSAKTIAAVERMAKADRRQATTVEQWDADDLTFSTEEATFDLHTGTSYPPRPSDYITKTSGCRCAPPGTPHRHAGAPWRREIMRLTKTITGNTIWAGQSKTARNDGKVVRINAPHPQTGVPSLPQKIIARWPHDGLGIDFGRFENICVTMRHPRPVPV